MGEKFLHKKEFFSKKQLEEFVHSTQFNDYVNYFTNLRESFVSPYSIEQVENYDDDNNLQTKDNTLEPLEFTSTSTGNKDLDDSIATHQNISCIIKYLSFLRALGRESVEVVENDDSAKDFDPKNSKHLMSRNTLIFNDADGNVKTSPLDLLSKSEFFSDSKRLKSRLKKDKETFSMLSNLEDHLKELDIPYNLGLKTYDKTKSTNSPEEKLGSWRIAVLCKDDLLSIKEARRLKEEWYFKDMRIHVSKTCKKLESDFYKGNLNEEELNRKDIYDKANNILKFISHYSKPNGKIFYKEDTYPEKMSIEDDEKNKIPFSRSLHFKKSYSTLCYTDNTGCDQSIKIKDISKKSIAVGMVKLLQVIRYEDKAMRGSIKDTLHLVNRMQEHSLYL